MKKRFAMRFSDVVEAFALREPSHNPVDAALAIEATLTALSELVPRNLALALVRLLPGEVTLQDGGAADEDVGRFYARIAEHTGTSLAQAAERAQIALSVLGSTLDADLRRRLERELP